MWRMVNGAAVSRSRFTLVACDWITSTDEHGSSHHVAVKDVIEVLVDTSYRRDQMARLHIALRGRVPCWDTLCGAKEAVTWARGLRFLADLEAGDVPMGDGAMAELDEQDEEEVQRSPKVEQGNSESVSHLLDREVTRLQEMVDKRQQLLDVKQAMLEQMAELLAAIVHRSDVV
eukprot:TRINITY_DN36902_c0_g1_i1.p1 TRINITY_DN36902_c0_g1~~TRINITY_DN36902_c0_g1_i1.p1  ORF type:complete len:174 (-),score=35.62 TRINITY_DN36902_c0_g1_i1:162-683(-)